MEMELFKDGFVLNSKDHGVLNISPLSLKLAIQSYFSTYQAIKHNYLLFKNPTLHRDFTQKDIDRNYYNNYYECYAETITHFQHFIEICLKRILQSKHILLSEDITDPVILFRYLNKDISTDEIHNHNTKSIGYKETLDRVCKLIKKDIIEKEKYQFILDNIKVLNDLANLRNRLIHSGMYIIRYQSLDHIIGRYVLPFAIKLAETEEIPERFWKYTNLDCEIDPINEIVELFKKKEYEMGKVAFLKELGRAAYENQLIYTIFYRDLATQYEKLATPDYRTGIVEVTKCPVCGLNTLRIYQDSDGDQDDNGNYISHWTFIYNISCMQCGFELNREIENPKIYGYNLPDWFWAEED